MKQRPDTDCPVCFCLDLFGDKWSLLIVRDSVVLNKRYYRDFLNSGEGISTNILADRLKRLVESGLLARVEEPGGRHLAQYVPTERAHDLMPVLEAMAGWAAKHGPQTLVIPTQVGTDGDVLSTEALS